MAFKRHVSKQNFLSGFLLLPIGKAGKYRGVDRDPFGPNLPANENEWSKELPHTELLWELHPPGWKRDAYRLFEENMICGEYDIVDIIEGDYENALDSLELITSRDVAAEIQVIIQPHLGLYEIVECKVWKFGTEPRDQDIAKAPSLGYDIAYPGGTFWSAICDGIIGYPQVNRLPSYDLIREYGYMLNDAILFPSIRPISEYLARYREIVLYEAERTYCVYWLNLA